MKITTITRAKGGKAEREVHIDDIELIDVRPSPLFLPDDRWVTAVARYHDDLGMLLACVRQDLDLPDEFFVPDLWDTATKLPDEERESMLEMWSLGHDIATSVGYRQSATDDIRNDVGGSVYVRAHAKPSEPL